MPVEIERRFLIHGPGVPPDGWWPVLYHDHFILQTYLRMPAKSPPGSTERVRLSVDARTQAYTWTHTKKVPRRGGEGSEETEREVTERSYTVLCKRYDPECVPLRKTRRVFEHEGRKFELDTYVGILEGLVVLEVELPSLDAPLVLPPWLPVEREVTGDKRYSNYGLARTGKVP